MWASLFHAHYWYVLIVGMLKVSEADNISWYILCGKQNSLDHVDNLLLNVEKPELGKRLECRRRISWTTLWGAQGIAGLNTGLTSMCRTPRRRLMRSSVGRP